MKTFCRRLTAVATIVLAVGAVCSPAARSAVQQAPPAQKTFASPEDAVKALRAAAGVHDKAALEEIFGPGVRKLLTGIEKRDKADSHSFAQAMEEGANPIPEGDERIVLEIGRNKWPFPIPLVKEGSSWRFDTAAGEEEILDRHIGKDELHAIGVCEAYARAQKQHAGGPSAAPKPLHGYLFRIPTPHDAAPGGFALEAYPIRWGRSGIMTFIVGQDGKIYQRDLGEKTSKIAAAMTEYDPDGGWMPVKEQGIIEK